MKFNNFYDIATKYQYNVLFYNTFIPINFYLGFRLEYKNTAFIAFIFVICCKNCILMFNTVINRVCLCCKLNVNFLMVKYNYSNNHFFFSFSI